MYSIDVEPYALDYEEEQSEQPHNGHAWDM